MLAKFVGMQVILCVMEFPNQIKKNEMGVACSTYGGKERCIPAFGWETGGQATTWETQADNIKMDLQDLGWGHGLALAGSG
jgi:hypothetical protein